MADQYGLLPEDYAYDLKFPSSTRYGQGMPVLIPLFSKQQLKPSRVIIATLMAYDFINHIPQQVSLSICKQQSHIPLSPRFSISIGMFLIRLPTIVTDGQNLRRKWSRLHVIYFSVPIINFTGMM